jgi:inosose dehydratase
MGTALVSTRSRHQQTVKIGYAAITWGGNDLQAIDDISSLGYGGIQLRSNVLARFGDRPSELRELLSKRKLTFVALSSGSAQIDSKDPSAMIASHLRNARFLRDAGGLYLQITIDRPMGRVVTDADYVAAGRLLTDIGRLTADLGAPLVLHPHMGSLVERPDELDRVMDATDSRVVRLLLDVAHYRQGGGDPPSAIRKYRDRLLLLHMKDVRDTTTAAGYQFVELGRGKVDVRAIFSALADIAFQGWAIVELDDVPERGRTPRESAEISRQFLASIGVRVSNGR